jgi:hypothetical protein
VQSVVVMPELSPLGITARQEVIDDYLKVHLPEEHYVHLSLTVALTPEEYDETDWRPSVPTLSLAPT